MTFPIDQVSAKELTLIASPLKGSQLHIEQGQIFSGRVLSVTNDGIIVNLAGLKILAKTNLSLVEGSSIRVRVEELADDKIILRLLGSDSGLKATLTPLNNSDIKEMLIKFGLPQSGINTEIIKVLVESGVPVTKEMITEADHLLKQLGSSGSSDIKSVISLMSRDIPVTKETMAPMNNLLTGKLIGEQILNLLNSSADVSGNVKDKLDIFIGVLRNIIVNNPELSSGIENSIKSFINQLGFERNILGGTKGNLSDLGIFLKPALLEIMDSLENQIKTPANTNIASSVKNVLDNFVGQQVVSNSLGSSNQSINYAYVQIPLVINNNVETIQLVVKNDSGSKEKLDPQNSSFAIFLNLPAMGMFGVDLKFISGSVGCTFFVENNELQNYVDSRLFEIDEIFKDQLGYKNIEFKCRVADKNEIRTNTDEILFPYDPRKVDIVA